MTEQKIVLTHSGYQGTVYRVLETAIAMFFPDKGAEILQYYEKIEIGKYVTNVKKEEKKGWFHKSILVDSKETVWKSVIVADWNNYYGKVVLTITSFYPANDDAAIWIAGQLEKIFDAIIVYVNDSSKLGHAIGWRCAYCNTLQTTKKCDNCGAPRAW